MKILVLNFEKSWRGGERQTLYNMQGYRDANQQVELACRRGSPAEAKAKAEGFTVYAFTNTIALFFFLAVKGSSYNYLHAQTSHILTWCVLAKPFHRSKIIFTRRVNFVQKGFFTKLKYRHTDVLVAVSQAVRQTLATFTNRQSIPVISDIVITKSLNAQRAIDTLKNLQAEGKQIIVSIAALTPEKAPLLLAQAIHQLTSKQKNIAVLHFGEGVLKPELEQYITANNLQSFYYLMGFADTPEDFLAVADVFVLCSQQEGLGSSVLDAFAYKVPVVATNTGGLAELLAQQRGVLCPVNDAAAIATGINTLLNDIALKEQCVANALQYVQSHHSMQAITNKYLALMNK
jgi:glycosyltransferase involved in cell wall biosynthesis